MIVISLVAVRICDGTFSMYYNSSNIQAYVILLSRMFSNLENNPNGTGSFFYECFLTYGTLRFSLAP